MFHTIYIQYSPVKIVDRLDKTHVSMEKKHLHMQDTKSMHVQNCCLKL